MMKDKKHNDHKKQKNTHIGVSDIKLVSFGDNIFTRNYPEHIDTSGGFEDIEK